jgi:hypothetical protein
VALGRDETRTAPRERSRGAVVDTLATVLLVGAVAALTVVAAGCGGAAGVPPKRPPSPPQPGTGADALPPSMRPNEVTVEPAVDLHAEPWTNVESSPDSRQLRIHATLTGGPPCAVLGGVDVRETAEDVTVTLRVGRRPGADCDGPQRAIGFPIVVTVDLKEPLGRRPIHDGAR